MKNMEMVRVSIPTHVHSGTRLALLILPFILIAALIQPSVAQTGSTNAPAAEPSAIPAGKILIFNPRTRDLKEFTTLARAAKEAGFTHVVISELTGRTDLQGVEKDSPWCEWSSAGSAPRS